MAISMRRRQRIILATVILIAALAACAPAKQIRFAGASVNVQDESDLVGDWSGESICQDKNPSCHDEKNVYHISKSEKPGILTISADKIVNGKAVNMGSIDFKYDKENKTLISESDRAVWRFVVKDRTMEGTLNLMPGKRLFRRITLKKDQ